MMPGPAAPAMIRAASMFLLALITVGAFCVRIAAIAEPLGIDQSLWASAARGMTAGQRLYADVWEQRPPGIYWIYVAGFRVFGWTPAAVVWLDLLASAATCTFLALIALKLADARVALSVAAIYATLTTPAWLYGHGGFLERSVCETFIVACVACGAWAALHVADTGSRLAAVALGLSAGAAVVLKPNAGLYLPALLLWLGLYGRSGVRARSVLIAATAATVVPLIALVWLWRLDILHEARVAVIDFNRYYVSEGFSPARYAVDFSKAVWLRVKTDPLWLAGMVGSAAAVWDLWRRRELPPLTGLAIIWGAAAVLVIVVNGARLFNSYFMNALPPLSLMAGWLLAQAWRGSRGRQALAACTALLMAVLLVQRGYAERVLGWAVRDLDRLRGRVDSTRYLEEFGGYANGRGYSARANAELAEYIRHHTSEDDRIFLFGISGAGVYFGSGRLTAHRFIRVNFFVDTDFPDRQFRLDSVLADLAAARPRYIIFERLHGASSMARTADDLPNQPAVQALLRSYRLDTRIEDFVLYRRNN